MPLRPSSPAPGWDSARWCVATTTARHAPLAAEKQQAAKRTVHKRYNERRDESDAFYKTERWKKLSAYYRKKHPVCEHCHNSIGERVGLLGEGAGRAAG